MRPIWLLLSIVLLNCSDRADLQECEHSSECPLPEQCIDDFCLLECRIDTDCDDFEGHQCVENVCHDPDMVCQTDSDCRPFHLICSPISRRCRTVQGLSPCNPTRPCGPGFICATNLCFPENEGGDTPRVDGSLPIIDAGSGIPILDAQPPRRDMAQQAPPRDASRPPPRDAAPPRRDMSPPMGDDEQYGEPCQCSSDCASGFCVLNPYNQFAGQCSAQCRGGLGCPGQDACIATTVPGVRPGCQVPQHGLPEGSQVEICVPNETGQACMPEVGCPLGSLCVQPANPLPGQIEPAHACGTSCRGDAECPTGFGCSGVQTPQGVVNACGTDVTINPCPNGTIEMCGGVCPGAGNDANVAHCISTDANGMAPGFCTCSCNGARDCPSGFGCERSLDSGDPARPGICVPIAGYTCPEGDNNCPSFLCVPDPLGDGINRCSSSCQGMGDCPIGFGCVPAGQFSICVPQ